jgi:hypothetical protein
MRQLDDNPCSDDVIVKVVSGMIDEVSLVNPRRRCDDEHTTIRWCKPSITWKVMTFHVMKGLHHHPFCVMNDDEGFHDFTVANNLWWIPGEMSPIAVARPRVGPLHLYRVFGTSPASLQSLRSRRKLWFPLDLQTDPKGTQKRNKDQQNSKRSVWGHVKVYKSRSICWWVLVTVTSGCHWRNGKFVYVSVCVCVCVVRCHSSCSLSSLVQGDCLVNITSSKVVSRSLPHKSPTVVLILQSSSHWVLNSGIDPAIMCSDSDFWTW